jgi:hypothetical protein
MNTLAPLDLTVVPSKIFGWNDMCAVQVARNAEVTILKHV